MSKVEKVARILRDEFPDSQATWPEDYREVARRVILALRGSSPEMIHRGTDIIDGATSDQMGDVWDAMIYQALRD